MVEKRPILVVCIIKSASSDVQGDGQSWFLAVALGAGAGPSQFRSFAFRLVFLVQKPTEV